MIKYQDIQSGSPIKASLYQIKVLGELHADWSEKFAGLDITVEQKKNKKTVSALVGRLKDQAELSEILNALYNLHMSILSVERLNDDK